MKSGKVTDVAQYSRLSRTGRCQHAFEFATPNLPSFLKDRAHRQHSAYQNCSNSTENNGHHPVTRPNYLQIKSSGMPPTSNTVIRYDAVQSFSRERKNAWQASHRLRSSGYLQQELSTQHRTSAEAALRLPSGRHSLGSKRSVTVSREVRRSLTETQRMQASGLPSRCSYRAHTAARMRCASAYFEPTATRGLLSDAHATPYTQGMRHQRRL